MSQARGLGGEDPDLPPTLCCVTLDELLAILSSHARIQAGRSLEYATLQSHLLPSSQNEAQYYPCQMAMLGRRKYVSPTLKVLLNPVRVLLKICRHSEVG